MPSAYSIQRHWYLVTFGCLLLAVGITERIITGLAVFPLLPLLPGAVTFDLLVVVPLLFYLLIVRPYRLSPASIGGVVGACLAFAFWLIPASQQESLRVLRFLPALLEVLMVSMLLLKAKKFIHAYRAARAQSLAVWPSIRIALQESLGKVGLLLVSEIEMLRCAVVGWWMFPEEVETDTKSFSSYRESGFVAFIVMLVVIVLVEATVAHLLVMHWKPGLAKWFLLAEIYTVVFVIAHGHAVRLRPSLLQADHLIILRVGLLWELQVSGNELLTVEPLRDTPAAGTGIFNLSKHLFASPNLLLTFSQPVEITGPFGLHRSARQVAFYVDQPQEFTVAAREIVSSASQLRERNDF